MAQIIDFREKRLEIIQRKIDQNLPISDDERLLWLTNQAVELADMLFEDLEEEQE